MSYTYSNPHFDKTSGVVTFVRNGQINSNVWLMLSTNTMRTSNNQPLRTPFQIKLSGLSIAYGVYVNGASHEIEIYVDGTIQHVRPIAQSRDAWNDLSILVAANSDISVQVVRVSGGVCNDCAVNLFYEAI